MTGCYGLKVLNKIDPDLIQKTTLDNYNFQLNLYNTMFTPSYNFSLSFLPNNGGYSSWQDSQYGGPDPGMPGENSGELQFLIGGDSGGDGGGVSGGAPD